MAKTDPEPTHRVLRRIAVGGMAEVFLATPPGGGDPVVLKVLLPHLVKDAEVVSAFRHEAELGQRLAHPRIVRVRAAGTREGAPYLVLDRVVGATLADVLDRAGAALHLGCVVAVGLDVLEALGHAHQATDDAGAPLGLVHRDVSPRNLFIAEGGRTLLADFGIARSALREGRTRTGAIKGTLGYLSPEQVTGSEVDGRADLFALGAVLFEIATGAPFLAAGSDLERLRAAEAPAARAPSASGADPKLDAVLRRALARFPEERYASADAMRRALAATATPDEVEAGRAELGALAATLFAEENATESPLRDPESSKLPAIGEGTPPPAGRAVAWRWLLGGALLASAAAVMLASRGADDAARAPDAARGTITSTSPTRVESSAAPATPSSGMTSASVPSLAASGSASSGAARARPAISAAPRPATSGAASSAPAPEASAAPELPAPSASSVAPPSRAAAVRAKLDATNARLREARRRGVDTGPADARIAVALEALMDRRYDDAERELDAIASSLPP